MPRLPLILIKSGGGCNVKKVKEYFKPVNPRREKKSVSLTFDWLDYQWLCQTGRVRGMKPGPMARQIVREARMREELEQSR